EARRVVVDRERRGEPPGVELARGARRRRGRGGPEALQQRHRPWVGRAAQSLNIPLGEPEATFHRGAPGDECGGGAGHGRDPQDPHTPNPTPPAGGAMPRPRHRTRYGAASTSTAAPTTFHQRRPSPRRHSVLAAQSATTPSTVSAPAEALNAPSTGR